MEEDLVEGGLEEVCPLHHLVVASGLEEEGQEEGAQLVVGLLHLGEELGILVDHRLEGHLVGAFPYLEGVLS